VSHLPAILLTLLLLSQTAHAYRLLPGPMPKLQASPESSEPAPVPNQDLEPPAAATIPGTRLTPSLTNRLSGRPSAADGYSPGSAFAPELERRHDTGTNLGSILAPGLQLRVPLK
jgi:hypothetical protein